jgi:DNA modification methylase
MDKLENLELFNGDCFDIFPNIQNKSVNLFLLDLPYNQTACNWDKDIINLEEMWKHIKRTMKQNAIIIFFCTAKFGYRIIHSNPKWFRYDLIWKKSRKVGFLSANKMPLRQHENIYLFSCGNNDDIEVERNKDLRQYAQKVKDYIGKGLKKINDDMGNRHAEHFFYITSSQFGIPTEITYNKLIQLYNINEMQGFIKYEDLKEKWEKGENYTLYNPQKLKGKAYKMKAQGNREGTVYGDIKKTAINNTGDRHPSSIIDHDNIYIFKDKAGTYHPQKTTGHKARDRTENKKPLIPNTGYGNLQITANSTDETRHPTSIITHDNIYIFKEKGGTNNPQKTKRDKDYKHSGKRSSEEHYDNKIECKKECKKEDGKHPTSVIEENKDLGEIKGGYYRGEGKKPFKRMPTNKEERHPTSIIELDAGRWCEEDECCEYGDLNRTLTDCSFCPNKFFPFENHQIDFDLYNRYYTEDDDGDICYHCLRDYYKEREIPEYTGDTIVEFKNPHKTVHRTQKPVELCEWLIKTYSNEGDKIMDFTMGSGTVAIACLNTNRKFIGIEKDKEIYKIAQNRIIEHLDL